MSRPVLMPVATKPAHSGYAVWQATGALGYSSMAQIAEARDKGEITTFQRRQDQSWVLLALRLPAGRAGES